MIFPERFSPPFSSGATGSDRLRVGCIVAGLLLAAAGCGESEQITTYSVPKQEQKMFGAIVPAEGRAWFFKTTVPVEIAEQVEPQFDALIGSLTFAGAGPEWSLPAGWRRLPDDDPKNSGMFARYATLMGEVDGRAVELAVTQLARPGGEMEGYLLANINRWRGQLGLAPVGSLEESEELQQMTVDGKPVTVVKLQGVESSGGMGQAPFASGGMPKSLPRRSPAAQRPPPELSYTKPEHWTPGRMSALREAAFEVRDGDQQVEITIISAGGDVLGNVNRWRGEIQLPPVTQDELQRQVETIQVDGEEAVYVELVGPESADRQETILALIADGTRFIKLKGDSELAAREKENFEAFVRSIRFDASDGSR